MPPFLSFETRGHYSSSSKPNALTQYCLFEFVHSSSTAFTAACRVKRLFTDLGVDVSSHALVKNACQKPGVVFSSNHRVDHHGNRPTDRPTSGPVTRKGASCSASRHPRGHCRHQHHLLCARLFCNVAHSPPLAPVTIPLSIRPPTVSA